MRENIYALDIGLSEGLPCKIFSFSGQFFNAVHWNLRKSDPTTSINPDFDPLEGDLIFEQNGT